MKSVSMKELSILISLASLLLFFQTAHAQNYDYLESTTSTTALGDGITANNSTNWTDIYSVTIDVTEVSNVLVTASINMRPDGDNTNGREANYNIYNNRDGNESGVIKRQMLKNSEAGVESWGIGTLVHIFDVSSLAGDITYTLEHSNWGASEDDRNVYSTARLTAVALTTATSPYYELSNDVKRLDADVSTTSSTYAVVTGTTTDAYAITLPIKGDIFVTASINAKGTSGSVAEYKLESSTDGGSTWADLGKPVKRSIINTYDDGIVSLVGILQDQDADNDFRFRIAHKRESVSGTIITTNCNIVAVALAHSGGGYFPTFYSEIGTTGVDVDWGDDPESVTSSSFTAAANIGTTGPALYVNVQYLIDATNLKTDGTPERMRAGNQLYISDGTTTTSALEYYYYIPDNVYFGSAGFIGLVAELAGSGSYTIGMQHRVKNVSNHTAPEDEILTTSEVILCGFQTYDQPHFVWDGSTNGVWETADNWSNNEAPTAAATFDVTIPNVTNDPSISGTTLREVNDLFITDGVLTIEDDAKLTVNGDLSNSSGTLTLESTATGTGSLIVEGTSTGTATVQRYVASDAWHGVSPSTTGINSGDFYIDASHDSWLTEFSESAGDHGEWTYITSITQNLDIGSGFSYWVSNANSTTHNTVEFTGELRTTDLVQTLAFTNGDHGWNSLGNPFACALDLGVGTWDPNIVTSGSVYVWDQTKGASGDYVVSGTDLTGNIIPVGQGFFVDASSAGIYPIPADGRVHSSQSFWKSSENREISKMVRVQLSGDNIENTVYLGFPEFGTDERDYAGDARKLYSSNETPQLFAIENNIELCVNTNAPLTEENNTKTVPLHLVQVINGDYTLSISQLERLPDTKITLEDLKTGATQDFVENNIYSFTASKDDSPERFLLHFAWSPDGIGEDFEDASNIQIYSYGKDVYIRSTEEAINQNGNVFVYDLMGRELANYNMLGTELFKIPINTNNNYVVVKVVKDGSTKTQKVYIK